MLKYQGLKFVPNLRLRHSGRRKKGLLIRPERNEKYIRPNK